MNSNTNSANTTDKQKKDGDDFYKKLEKFKKSIEFNNSIDKFDKLFNFCRENNNLDFAKNYLKKAKEGNLPEYQIYYNNLACFYKEQGKEKENFECLEVAAELDRNNNFLLPEAVYNYGIFLRKEERYKDVDKLLSALDTPKYKNNEKYTRLCEGNLKI